MAKPKPPSFRPPGRKRTTRYPWGGIDIGAAGVVTRTWTRQGQRILNLTFDPDFPMIQHREVASIHPPDSPWYEGPGRLDQSNYAYHLTNTFRKLRNSIFAVYVQVSATYADIDGIEYTATAQIKTKAEFPMWVKASDQARYWFYSQNRRSGSFYTDREAGKFKKIGRRTRRMAPAVEREYESPPDLFWLTAYAIWFAMEKCTMDLQDRGRAYLDRLSFVQYNIDDITVVQEEVVEE